MTRISKQIQNWFGGNRTSKPRRTTRLGLERLDDRLLPSNTGAMSSVYTPQVGNVTYYINANDQNLYESMNGGPSYRIDNGYCDLEVSAGTDAAGNTVAYVLNNSGELWALTTSFNGNGVPFVAYYNKIRGDVIHDPYNHWMSFSAAMGRDSNGTPGGVFYISDRYDRYFNFVCNSRSYINWGYQISNAPLDYEISAGTDHYGYNIAYVLNGVNHNVFAYHANGSWSMIECLGGCMEIAGSTNSTLYVLQDPSTPDGNGPYLYDGLSGTYHYYFNVTGGIAYASVDGVGYEYGINEMKQVSLPGQYATHICAGTDRWGNPTLDYLATPGWLSEGPQGGPYQAYQWDGVTTLLSSSAMDVCAGYGGFNLYVGSAPSAPVFYLDPWGDSWVIGTGVRHDAYWW
jgi:hypothetical protein